jgi:Pectate lyase superfamily protein
MFRSTSSAGSPGNRNRPRTVAIAASFTAAAVGASLALAPGAVAGPSPLVQSFGTRAALAPALTAGKGADLGFVEQEAETATTTGSIIGPSTDAYTLPAEASGRSAVKLTSVGQYVEFTLPKAANGLTVRYSIPDAPNGGGILAPINLLINGKHVLTPILTSQYAWLYNVYPFTNDPNAVADAPAPGDWITECSCVPTPAQAAAIPTPFRPNHFYDEQRILLDKTYAAGTKVRFQVPEGSPASSYVIDLLDSQLVGPAIDKPHGALSVVDFGADPTGAVDSGNAFDAAVAAGAAQHRAVYIPEGEFQLNRHVVLPNNVTLTGAGSWYSIITGHETPATDPDGSAGHTGPGIYGKYVGQGGPSQNVHISNFAIEGDVDSRVDEDQVNGIGGALGGGSTVSGMYIDHTKAGIWLDGPFSGLTVSDNVIVNQLADGINLHDGVSHVLVQNNFFRNTGDDAMAMWSETNADHDNRFDHNTVQTPVLANGIAIYGGRDNAVSDNLIADPIREGSALQIGSRFGATPFQGSLWIDGNTTVRAGTFELNWNIGLGAIWIYALESSISANIQVTNDNFLDNTYNAIMEVSDFPVKDLYTITNVHYKNIHVDGTGTSVFDARVAGSASFQNVDARNVGAVGINNCGSFHFTPAGSEFTVIDQGGNDGGGTTGPWLAPWELPNTITCDDRPPVVVPPVPTPWS